jgi:23S rRNA A1618 N6-methylase RlmF
MSRIEQVTGTEEAEFDLTQSEVDPNSLEAARKIIARQQARMREL